MTLSSRYFGEIDARGIGRAGVSAAMRTNSLGSIDITLDPTEPLALRQQHLDQADMALDQFGTLDDAVRALVISAATDESSVPGRLFSSRVDLDPDGTVTPEAFASSFSPVLVRITPDGRSHSPDRVFVSYASEGSVLAQSFVAIVREGEGLVFADAGPVSGSSSQIVFG
jgi:hypothetical protein